MLRALIVGTARAECIGGVLVATFHDDSRPLPGGPVNGYYYLASGRGGCGDGGLAPDSFGRLRLIQPCP